LPIVLPLAKCALFAAFLIWTITWVSGDWTDGERSTQLAYLRGVATSALLAFGAYVFIKLSDRGAWWWWWVAWVPGAIAVVISIR
jgi:hypothetical protein